MKTFPQTLILLALILLTGCAPKGIPKHIQKAQKDWQEQQKRTVQNPDIIEISPIDAIPDTSAKKFLGIFNIQNAGNWGYDFTEVHKYESFIKANAKRDVIVFVFDTGADSDHPSIKNAIIEGYNFTTLPSKNNSFLGEFDGIFTDVKPWDDGHGHGTHVSSTILGKSNGAAKVGIAEPLAEVGKIKLIPIKVLGDDGRGYSSWIANGVKKANERAAHYIDKGFAVIYNFSLGGSGFMSNVDILLKEAESLGVLVNVCANGNTGRESSQYPASSKYTESIVALQSNGKRATFSTIGDFSTFSAPGQSIYGAYKNGGYASLSGTSMASPTTAGLYAIYMSCNPEITAKQAKAHFRNTAIDLQAKGWDKYTGYGTLKLSKIFASNPPPPDDEPNKPPTDEPSQPDPPKDEPGNDYPTLVSEYQIYKKYSMTWSTMDNQSDRKKLVSTIKVRFKHNLGVPGGAIEALKLSDSYFKNRGLVLPAGSNEIDAAYWTAYFYRLILKKKADIRVIDMDIDFGGVTMKSPRIPENANAGKIKRLPLITYSW